MKTIPFAILSLVLASIAVPATAQQNEGTVRKVLAERRCNDGSTTLAVLTGDMIVLEYYSAPHPDGTVSGYEDAYDRKNFEEAKAQFQALRCPEKR